MPKRQRKTVPALWYSEQSGMYLAPYDQKEDFDTLRSQHPRIKVCYINVWSILACLIEMFFPHKFETQGSDYYIVPSRTYKKPWEFKINNRYTVKWNGNGGLTCLGSELCGECFKQGQLRPYTCAQHVKCEHNSKQSNCDACIAKTLKGTWKEWVACYKDQTDLMSIARSSESRFNFECYECHHPFLISPKQIDMGHFCSFCASKILCTNDSCSSCFGKSFASSPRVGVWCQEKNGNVRPRDVFKHSNKQYWFKCDVCFHPFLCALNNITYGKFCPFCARKSLCLNDDCKQCFNNSFASCPNSKFWDKTVNGDVTPRQVAKHSGKRYGFHCPVCNHKFESTLNKYADIEDFCPYCANRVMCLKEECTLCYTHSMASHYRADCLDPNLNEGKIPREIHQKMSKQMYWWRCPECKHPFDMSLEKILLGHFCPFCAHQRHCNIDNCKMCQQVCDICLVRIAKHVTRISKYHCCTKCLRMAITNDPKDAPLKTHASVSMEQHFLCELQTCAEELLSKWATSWDTAVLPGLAFMPDYLYAFDHNGQVIVTKENCKTKLDITNISYMLQVEVMEINRAYHTAHRDPPDEVRKVQIRDLFNRHNINIGIVWVTVGPAQCQYGHVHDDDIFYEKTSDTGEYFVSDHRWDAFLARVEEVGQALKRLYDAKSNETILIGH